MRLRKKEAISSFVQSGNIEVLSQAEFEPGTLRVAAGPLIHYTKLPYNYCFFKFKRNFKRFLQSFSSRVASWQSDQRTFGNFLRKDKKQDS